MISQNKSDTAVEIENAATVADQRPVTVIARSMEAAKDPLVASEQENEFRARYEMSALLGEGGVGEVRLCRDSRIGRDVTLKEAESRLSLQAWQLRQLVPAQARHRLRR